MFDERSRLAVLGTNPVGVGNVDLLVDRLCWPIIGWPCPKGVFCVLSIGFLWCFALCISMAAVLQAYCVSHLLVQIIIMPFFRRQSYLYKPNFPLPCSHHHSTAIDN
jgi:hypothetical protein